MFPWPSHVWSVTDELWHHTHRWPKDAEARSGTHPRIHTSRGGLPMGSCCLKMKFHSVRRRITMCWDLHVWMSVPPLRAVWILNNIVLSFFSSYARWVLYQEKKSADFFFPPPAFLYPILLCSMFMFLYSDDCLPSFYHITQKATWPGKTPRLFHLEWIKMWAVQRVNRALMKTGADCHRNIDSDKKKKKMH